MSFRPLVALALAAALLPPAVARADMPQEALALFKKHRVNPKRAGLVIRRLDDNLVVAEHQANRAFNPASVAKLFTAFAALDLLGPNFKWKTSVFADGKIADGVLQGNLYFAGGGDPTLTPERFLHLLSQLRAAGLQTIKGDLVLDAGDFAPAPHDEKKFDGAEFKPYNVGAGGLVVGLKATRVVFAAAGRGVHVYTDPPNKNFVVVNKIKRGKVRCRNWRGYIRERYGGNSRRYELRLSGRYSQRCGTNSFYISSGLTHEAHVAGVFAAMWESLGGKWEGGWRLGKPPKNAARLLRVESPPLAQTLANMNKFSNNVIARNVFLSLPPAGEPRNETRARAAMQEWLQGLGIVGVFIDNGSGLSRRARAGANSIADLLQAAHKSPHRAEFAASLPIYGVDGTLLKRRGRAMRGNARLKTGSLNEAKTIAGYFLDERGRHYIMTLLLADTSRARAHALQNSLLRWARKIP